MHSDCEHDYELLSVEPFSITEDRHTYKCSICGAIEELFDYREFQGEEL